MGGIGSARAGRAEAKAARLNAQQIRERATIESTLRARSGLREAGTIAAAAGANNLTRAGSAAAILGESARNTAFDLLTIRTQSELEARATILGGKAKRAAGNVGFLTGGFDAASQLIKGIP